MARRIDRVRPGQDAVSLFLKEHGERLHTGVVRNGDSLGWIVDAMEWISYGEHLADQLIERRYDTYAFLAEHPLIDVILDQFVRRGEPGKVYEGFAGLMEFTFREAVEISGADSLASLRNIGVGPAMSGEETANEAAAEWRSIRRAGDCGPRLV